MKARICKEGHSYYKSSDCPFCPICEKQRKVAAAFLDNLSAPAKRALENKGIDTLEKLSQYTEKEIIKLHGMGKTSLPKLRESLKEGFLSFKKN